MLTGGSKGGGIAGICSPALRPSRKGAGTASLRCLLFVLGVLFFHTGIASAWTYWTGFGGHQDRQEIYIRVSNAFEDDQDGVFMAVFGGNTNYVWTPSSGPPAHNVTYTQDIYYPTFGEAIKAGWEICSMKKDLRTMTYKGEHWVNGVEPTDDTYHAGRWQRMNKYQGDAVLGVLLGIAAIIAWRFYL